MTLIIRKETTSDVAMVCSRVEGLVFTERAVASASREAQSA